MGDNLGCLALPTLSSPTMSVESVVATAIAGALGLHLLLALLLLKSLRCRLPSILHRPLARTPFFIFAPNIRR